MLIIKKGSQALAEEILQNQRVQELLRETDPTNPMGAFGDAVRVTEGAIVAAEPSQLEVSILARLEQHVVARIEERVVSRIEKPLNKLLLVVRDLGDQMRKIEDMHCQVKSGQHLIHLRQRSFIKTTP